MARAAISAMMAVTGIAIGLTASAFPAAAQANKSSAPQVQKKASAAQQPKLKEAKAQLDSDQPAVNQNLSSLLDSKTPLNLEQYLAVMRPMIHRYNQVMLSLIANDGIATEEVQQDSQIGAGEITKLAQTMTRVNAPSELTESHASLVESLKPPADFVKAGGCAKQGFHRALECAKQMEKISATYHELILSVIGDHGLPAGSDPFIVARPVEKQQHQPATKTTGEYEKKAVKISDTQRAPFWVPDLVGANGSSYIKTHNTPGMINGVDGAMGLSGMFNGLGGTGTNGLVDGLGFSSGLNGFVNGAGSSSGMSGMMNDTESKK